MLALWTRVVAFFRQHFTLMVAALIVALCVGLWFMIYLYQHERHEKEIAQANLTAEQDSMRIFKYGIDTTMQAVARRQLQGQIERNQLSKDLQATLRTLGAVAKTVNDLQVKITSSTGHSEQSAPVIAGARTVVDSVAGPPIEGTITVAAPVDTVKPIVIDHRLSVTPFKLTYSIACTKTKPRTPITSIESPTWVQVELGTGTVDPILCLGEKPSLFGGLHLGSKESFALGGGTVLSVLGILKLLHVF